MLEEDILRWYFGPLSVLFLCKVLSEGPKKDFVPSLEGMAN
jgi:hypothetical protein